MFQRSGEIRRAFSYWGAANLLGFSIPPLIIFIFPRFTSGMGLLSTILIISLPLSIAQWAALRRTLPVSILWIFSIPVIVLIGVIIVRELPEYYWDYIDSESLLVLSATSFIFGLLLSLPQWLILHYECSNSSIWLLGSTLGVGVGTSIVIATDLINYSGILAYSLAVAAYVVLTGLTLSWLINQKDDFPTSHLKAI